MTHGGRNVRRVLAVNCGSSSIKYQLLAMPRGQLIAGGVLERIGEAEPKLRHRGGTAGKPAGEEISPVDAPDHRRAMEHIKAVLERLPGAEAGIAAVGHRVVHGGEHYSAPTRLDTEVIETIRRLSFLAPLHNPVNLVGIESCMAAFPDVPQVAVFDTAFHQTMPEHAYRYAVPESWYRDHSVRRFGFHGTSHRFVVREASRFLGRPVEALNLISLHLGNGASAAAIEKGRCLDTSMGFSPLEGLMMGTRSGDLDASVPLYLQRSAGLGAAEIDHILNHEAGLQGICGRNDMRAILAQKAAGDEAASLALDMYCYRVKKYLGAYSAALGRVDTVVFTGGIGENAMEVRSQSCKGLGALGIALDENLNATPGKGAREIGRSDAAVRVLVVPTDEELQIARDTVAVLFGEEEAEERGCD